MWQIALITALIVLFASSVCSVNISLKSSRIFSKQAHLVASAFFLLSLGSVPYVALAEDCYKDCKKECLIVAPGSEAYCKETCKDYCSDTVQREKDKNELYPTGPDETESKLGYDRAFLRELNKPPTGPQIMPHETLKDLKIGYKIEEPRKGVFFKDLF